MEILLIQKNDYENGVRKNVKKKSDDNKINNGGPDPILH